MDERDVIKEKPQIRIVVDVIVDDDDFDGSDAPCSSEPSLDGSSPPEIQPDSGSKCLEAPVLTSDPGSTETVRETVQQLSDAPYLCPSPTSATNCGTFPRSGSFNARSIHNFVLRACGLLFVAGVLAKSQLDALTNQITYDHSAPINELSALVTALVALLGTFAVIHCLNPRWYSRIPTARVHIANVMFPLLCIIPLALSCVLTTIPCYLQSHVKRQHLLPASTVSPLTLIETFFSPALGVKHSLAMRNLALYPANQRTQHVAIDDYEEILLRNSAMLPEQTSIAHRPLDESAAMLVRDQVTGTQKLDALRKLIFWQSTTGIPTDSLRFDMSLAAAMLDLNNKQRAADVLQDRAYRARRFTVGRICMSTPRVNSLLAQMNPGTAANLRKQIFAGTLEHGSITVLDLRTVVSDLRHALAPTGYYAGVVRRADVVIPLMQSMRTDELTGPHAWFKRLSQPELTLLGEQWAMQREFGDGFQTRIGTNRIHFMGEPVPPLQHMRGTSPADLAPNRLLILDDEQDRALLERFGQSVVQSP